MNCECSIVRDLLPLYAEHMVREETADFIENHLTQCEACRKQLAEEQEPPRVQKPRPELPLVSLRHKLLAGRIQAIALTAIIVTVVLISIFAFLDAPKYFPYSPQLFSLTQQEDGSVLIVFDPKVTDYRCTAVPKPDSPQDIYYAVEAWSSQWDRHVSNRGTQSLTIQPENTAPLCIYYVSNDGATDDTCIFGQPLVPDGGMMTLPRLALGFYLVLMGFVFLLLLVLWLLARHRPRRKAMLEPLMLYPIAYAFSHLFTVGFTTISYAMQRDFTLILLLSLVLYAGLLLVRSYCRTHRSSKADPRF